MEFSDRKFSLILRYLRGFWEHWNCWLLDASIGRWTLDAGPWILDAGVFPLDSGLQTLCSGHWTLLLTGS